jgi:hypothetical protein
LDVMLIYGACDYRRFDFVVACIYRVDLSTPTVFKDLTLCNAKQVTGYIHDIR